MECACPQFLFGFPCRSNGRLKFANAPLGRIAHCRMLRNAGDGLDLDGPYAAFSRLTRNFPYNDNMWGNMWDSM